MSKSKKYTFSNFNEEEYNIIDRNIRQMYRMIDYVIKQLITAIGLVGTSSNSYDYSPGLNGLLNAAKLEFGDNSIKTLGDVKDKLLDMKNKLLRGLEITRHNEKNRNQIAEAETPGKKIWIGPKYYSNMSDHLSSRPRVLIHEVAHNIGLDHVFQGLKITANSNKTSAAQIAIGADGIALFCYRIYTGRYSTRISKMDDI